MKENTWIDNSKGKESEAFIHALGTTLGVGKYSHKICYLIIFSSILELVHIKAVPAPPQKH